MIREQDVRRLMDEYTAWLRDKTVLRQIGQWVEITTPFLDRHNDYLQIYARKSNGGFELTDDGYIINDLEHSGCKLESHRQKVLLEMTLNGFGVQRSGVELKVNATTSNFAQRKHNLVQAMLAVNDLFFLAEARGVPGLFYEDVVAWLDLLEVRYTPKVKFTGKTGYDHVFDFVIPKSKLKPERIIQTINRPSRDTAETLILAWMVTKEVRSPESRAYALLNDTDGSVSSTVSDALRSCDVQPVLWSLRDSLREEMVK